jgi:hypothetical protein
MKLLPTFWRYWKWLCVALMTSFIVLAALAAAINHFKSSGPSGEIGACIEKGGTWDDMEGLCKSAA